MPLERLARFTLLPELKLMSVKDARSHSLFKVEKTSKLEVCPRCATPSTSVYDSRTVRLKDAPIRGELVILQVRKRRFSCKPCGKPFTEPVSGVAKGHRTTQRYRRHVLWACENFSDLKAVRRHCKISTSSLYKILYQQLELQLKKRRYPWPEVIGIDEHKFKRHAKYSHPIFATNITDHSHKRLFELVEGRSGSELKEALKAIPGREKVKVATMDLCPPFRRFTYDFFPNVEIVADRFHVVRLLHPAINKHRIQITGDQRKNPARILLLKNGADLAFHERSALHKWLAHHPTLRELYLAKEAIHGLYRIRGYQRAKRAFSLMLDRFGQSELKEIKTLRKTLLNWRKEILNYFRLRYTNGRTEGFNGKAKLIKRKAYGFRSFRNYRLRVLMACT